MGNKHPPRTPLPKCWTQHVRIAMLHVVALAGYARAYILWLPFTLFQCWPFCWWVASVSHSLDMVSAMVPRNPSTRKCYPKRFGGPLQAYYHNKLIMFFIE